MGFYGRVRRNVRSMRLFILAWVQVSLISLNTWQIANHKIIGSIVVGFLISLVWTFNVQDISKSDLGAKFMYAGGAMTGTATGLALSIIFYE